MSRAPQILISTLALGICTAALAACGQQGPLYLPTEAAAAGRASLPQSLGLGTPAPTTAPAAAPASAAVTR